ncbi:Prostaglandin F synthase [Smittium mucronatum]|uniref:Prostaglandin F synthase n=1 Tax=Smittium mucronatum TaxID=133383 RepID=A0A1R0GLT5_9FUNG|nr:Prostaglandin F synthase [Smittium mucronatum]
MSFAKVTNLRDGLAIPTVGLGTWQQRDKSLMKQLVKDAIKVGYRHIDTATVYTNEDAIGDALSEVFADSSFGLSRSDIWVTSKLSPSDQGYESAITAVKRSLEKLKLSYIDMYLIHWPGTSRLPLQDPQHKVNRTGSWKALEELKSQGLIRAIGVSNYQISHLNEMKEYATVMPYVNQCEFHPLLFTKELVLHTQSMGIAFEAYSSLGEGNLVNGNYKFPVLDQIASKHNASLAQVLLCWGIQHGAIVLPKASSVGRLAQNYECQKITLSDEDMSAIDNISSQQTKRFCWDPTEIL